MEGTNSSQNNNNNQGNRTTEQNIFIRSPPFLPFIALRDLNPREMKEVEEDFFGIVDF